MLAKLATSTTFTSSATTSVPPTNCQLLFFPFAVHSDSPWSLDPHSLHLWALLQGGQLHPPLLKSLQLIDRLFDPDDLPRQAPAGNLDHFLFAPAPINRAHPNHCSCCVEPSLEFLRDDPLWRVGGLLGNNKCVGLDGHREDRLLPPVHLGELVDVGVEHGEGGVEVRDLYAKEENEDGGVVVEGVGPHLVKRLAKVLIDSWSFSELEYAVLDADAVLVMQGVEPESTNVAKAV